MKTPQEQKDFILKIHKIICSYLNVDYEGTFEKNREESARYPRQLTHYFMYKYFHKMITLKLIADTLGGQNHATVWHSHKVINDHKDTEKKERYHVKYLTTRLMYMISDFKDNFYFEPDYCI